MQSPFRYLCRRGSYAYKPIAAAVQACSASLAAAVLGVVVVGHAGVASAQGVKVSIDLSKEINILTSTSIGVPAIMFDGGGFNPAVGPYTRAAGATTIRYPGNHGVADIYHWSTNTLTKYKGSEAPYVSSDGNFGNFARNLDKFGTAFIVVNYGANLDGTVGGDAGEAAAWVAYANGDPSDPKPIVKDPGGDDWHTVGFWAKIRTEAPLQADDGYNFLRIAHPKPLGISLWQVGDQVYNNGYYGGDHVGDADLHGPAPSKEKDFAKLAKNPNLSPAFYGARVADYAKAMKDVDPSIKVGATLTTPPDGDKWAPDWNSKVLKAACGNLDFVNLEWITGGVMPPDYKTLDEANLLSGTRQQVSDILSGLLYDYKRNCPAGHQPRIAFAPAAIIPWPKVERPVIRTLWVADTYALLTETGAMNISWSEMHGDSMLSDDNKKFGPAYMGLQMLHILARNAGDIFVKADSSSSLVAVHATKRRDGVTGIMLVNNDPQNAVTVTVSLAGGTVGPKGKRFDYGLAQQKAGAPLAQSEIADLGGKFTVTVPAYTVSDIMIPAVK